MSFSTLVQGCKFIFVQLILQLTKWPYNNTPVKIEPNLYANKPRQQQLLCFRQFVLGTLQGKGIHNSPHITIMDHKFLSP